MVDIFHRVALVGAAALAALAYGTVITAGLVARSNADGGPYSTRPPTPASRRLRHLRQRGTATSRRTSRWEFARPFRSLRCVQGI
jgi:hypothetical protein